MLWTNQVSARRWTVLATIGVVGLLVIGGRGVAAQVSPSNASGATTPPDQNCAVTTASIGTVNVTEFFGVRGGASSFRDNFGAQALRLQQVDLCKLKLNGASDSRSRIRLPET